MYITEFLLYSVHNLHFSTYKIRKELYMLFFVTQIKYLSYYLAMQSKVKFKKIEDSRKLYTYCTLYEHFLCTYSRIRTIKEYLVHWNNQF